MKRSKDRVVAPAIDPVTSMQGDGASREEWIGQTGAFIYEALRASPLVGAGVTFERQRTHGRRQIDLSLASMTPCLRMKGD